MITHNVLRTVYPTMSRPHPLCLFSEVASRLSSSGVPFHDFHRNYCTACGVTMVIFGRTPNVAVYSRLLKSGPAM